MMIIFVWIALSFLAAFSGEGKRIGYWGCFFVSLLLSPLIGLIIGLVSADAKKIRKCSFCGVNTGGMFCVACDKDASGNTKEFYKKRSVGVEYQNELNEKQKQNDSNNSTLTKVIIGLSLFVFVIIICIRFLK